MHNHSFELCHLRFFFPPKIKLILYIAEMGNWEVLKWNGTLKSGSLTFCN